MALLLWVCNLIFCVFCIKQSWKRRRLITAFWVLALYFGVLLAVKALTVSPYSSSPDPLLLETTMAGFVLLCNIGFFLANAVVGRVLRISNPRVGDLGRRQAALIRIIYGLLFILGCAIYVSSLVDQDYESFVNFSGSNWGQVFLYGATPLISYLAYRRKLGLALLVAAPFVLAGFLLNIRSFFALSLMPILFTTIFLPSDQRTKIHATSNRPPMLSWQSGMVATALVLAGILVSHQKLGYLEWPEEKLALHFFTVTERLSALDFQFGFESLLRFLWGIFAVVLKPFGIMFSPDDDPPVLFGTFIDDYAEVSGLYFHYPSLWYADLFAAFKFFGVILALVWGGIFAVVENLVTRTRLSFIVFIPFFSWMLYMFFRGAVGNATIGISYQFPLQLSLLCVLWIARRNGALYGK